MKHYILNFLGVLSAGIGLIFMQAYDALITNQLWVLILMIILCVLTALVLICICLQPRELYARVFRVPLVPLVPAISIFINIYLMLQLDVMTWIRFGVWMAIGKLLFGMSIKTFKFHSLAKYLEILLIARLTKHKN